MKEVQSKNKSLYHKRNSEQEKELIARKKFRAGTRT